MLFQMPSVLRTPAASPKECGFAVSCHIIESQHIPSWKGPTTRTEPNSWIPRGKQLREQDKDLVNAE